MDLRFFGERNLVLAGERGWYVDSCMNHLPAVWLCHREKIYTSYGTDVHCVPCSNNERRESWKCLRAGSTGPSSFSVKVQAGGKSHFIQAMNAAGLP